MSADVVAIVPAAGVGTRFNGAANPSVPPSGRSKLFVTLHGQPLLSHTLRALQDAPSIRWIVPVVRSALMAHTQALTERDGITKALPPCEGGDSRGSSVARGFAAAPKEAEWVLVHDGARPCVTTSLIEQAIGAALQDGGAVCGLPASLTVKAVDDDREVRLTLDREHLWFAQTPQVFRREWFVRALARAEGRMEPFPDDAALVEWAGFRVHMVAGDPLNIKVTTREDLMLADAILRYRLEGRGKREEGRARRGAKQAYPTKALVQ